MKIYIDKQYTKDLSCYTDEQLESWGIYSRKSAELPIKISDFDLSLNEDGYAVLSFKTANHKYLNVQYRTSSSRRMDEDYENKPWSSQGIEISTCEEFKSGEYYDGAPMMSSVSRLMIWLEPDTQQEKEAIAGVLCVMPTKCAYQMIVVPYNKFAPRDDSEFESIGELEDDVIYSNSLF
jgi:hypothetical protein